MFLRLIIYRIKVLLKNRVLLFWTFAFPVVLGLLFNFAFSGLDDQGQLETTKIGIVSSDAEKTENFETVLYSLENDGKPVYQGKQMSKKQAVTQLSDEKIAGYYEITPTDISLAVSQSGIPQTIMEEFLNQYLQQTTEIENLIASGSVNPQAISEDLFASTNYVAEGHQASSYSVKSFYFFTLVAMAIMYSFMWGLKNANDQQANQSANGMRLSLLPKNKLTVAIANLLASFVLFYSQSMIILAIFHFVYQVDFGNRWGWILLIYGVASLATLSLGTLIGNALPKLGLQQKISIGVGLSMAMSFFAGMMGSQSLKYWIDVNLPLLGKLNLVNLISDSLYQLFYYQSLNTFYINLAWLVGFTIVFMLLNYFFERRVQYDHL
ncbi:ABC transporter permease [Enterococcus alishanensis]|uniref:ABC transporter permease n=1 Tax=Enterococcus alishanensis TaxID=1303817 RepID=A0ABS6TCV2_9ENTE|nr:ABC transporter permease [Enterococcus alishanensis]MBV7390754.1 ABC transporter permease [Enterococcus alishanensis]